VLDWLIFIGAAQIIALTVALIPLEVSDQFGGYRIDGSFAHLLPGVGWAILGINLWKARTKEVVE
jgi:hypothetical protein